LTTNITNSYASIRPGDYVFGFFEDGVAAQSPVIMGVYSSIEPKNVIESRGFSSQRPEENIPQMPENQIDREPGQPTTPRLYRGVVEKTPVSATNEDLTHVCGFKFNLNFDVDLGLGELTAVKELATALQRGIQDGKKGVADAVRQAAAKIIKALKAARKAIISLLGTSDVTGVASFSFSKLKDLTRQLNGMLSEAAEMTYDIGRAIGVVQGIKELAAWITSLPQKIQEMVKQCLANFTNSVKKVVSDINALPSQVENSVKSQFANFTNDVNKSINTIKSELTTSQSSESTTMMRILQGDSSDSTLDALKTSLQPPSAKDILKSLTKTSLQRP
jgi:gas vesicle protein